MSILYIGVYYLYYSLVRLSQRFLCVCNFDQNSDRMNCAWFARAILYVYNTYMKLWTGVQAKRSKLHCTVILLYYYYLSRVLRYFWFFFSVQVYIWQQYVTYYNNIQSVYNICTTGSGRLLDIKHSQRRMVYTRKKNKQILLKGSRITIIRDVGMQCRGQRDAEDGPL